ncbi:MAG: Ig-like domain-containing protein, partial [Acidobacteriota bacterium]|nr:Ig-like domain-containing protein [Acidobacteriota bacterium]
VAPTVSLTAPSAGSTFTAPATINLTANAADSDGTVASVAFYANATLIGTDTSAPFASTWSGASAGSYSLTARATDNTGAVTTSSAVAITVQAATPTPNVAPTVSLTAPSAGSTFTAPATINLTANAADSDGTVASVAFYAGATLLGTDTSAPFASTWSGASAGSYSLTARATDNTGAATTSAPVSVTVQAGTQPPPAAWTSQDIGAVGLAGTSSEANGVFTIEGAGADIWNTADAFRYTWQPISGDVDVIARVSSIEYVHAWVKAGVMIREQLTADSPQAMMLVSPGKGLAFQRRITTAGLSTSTSGGSGTAPAWVKLERRATTITAYRSADGVAWTLVGSDMFTMGGTVYVGLAVSSHVTTSLATAVFDNVSIRSVGAGEPEPPPPSNVAPSVTVTAPVSGTTFIAPAATTVSAAASDSDGTVVRVDFYAGASLIGSDYAAPFQASWSGVGAGSYTLTARATDDDGAVTTSAPVTVTVQAQPPPPTPGLSAPWTSQDIGVVGAAGSASDASGVFTVKGAGSDIWATSDAFQYVWQPLTGDVDVVARVSSVENVHAWVKAGVMIREQLTADSAHALMLVSPSKGLAFQRRTAGGKASSSTSGGSGTAPNWVKLERRGNTITAYRSADGVAWTLVGSDTFTMGANVHVGLAVSSHVSGQLATAVFDSVTVTKK